MCAFQTCVVRGSAVYVCVCVVVCVYLCVYTVAALCLRNTVCPSPKQVLLVSIPSACAQRRGNDGRAPCH